MFTVLFTADIHESTGFLEELQNACLVHTPRVLLIGGDLVPKSLFRGNPDWVQVQGKYLRKVLLPTMAFIRRALPECEIYLDLGNDDTAACGVILAEAEAAEMIHLLHRRWHALPEGLWLLGYMAVPLTPFRLKDGERHDMSGWPTAFPAEALTAGIFTSPAGITEGPVPSIPTIEQELDELTSDIPGPFLFVSHAPPYGTDLDVLRDGRHVGSLAVRRMLERTAASGQFLASFHGHIHEAPEVTGRSIHLLGKAPCLNPGQSSGRPLHFAVVRVSSKGIASIDSWEGSEMRGRWTPA